MKIQCDVCNKGEASVFCSADEAALCSDCDHRVHHANKLAGKHQRFALLHPSPKQVPLCDICQERKAFLFCQQDRAILCQECDIPIHKANEHTQKHDRFLLTGVKVSATSAIYPSSSSSSSSTDFLTNGCEIIPNLKSQSSIMNNSVSDSPTISTEPSIVKTTIAVTAAGQVTSDTGGCIDQLTSEGGNVVTSSISEYLIEMLPGWQVEDFLDCSSNPYGVLKTIDDGLPFWDAYLESNLSSTFSSENMGIWVPQAPQPLQPCQSFASSNMYFGGQIGVTGSKEGTHIKSSRKWGTEDNCFAVPQITPLSTAHKRGRTLW